MRMILTGCAGFIGVHVAKRLLQDGCTIIGVDNLNDYYDVSLKKDRLNLLSDKNFQFFHNSIENWADVERIFQESQPEVVIHLAAQAGVRYSLQNPHAYINSNITGFINILEACRQYGVRHLIYASSSSVYGMNTKQPFSTRDHADHPVSVYAATKKAGELLAHTYSHNYGLPTTGLRFFTVYGPWGRPDMAYFSFTKAILAGQPIKIYNHGRMKRDFTYIDDIVEAIVRLIPLPPKPNLLWDRDRPDPGSSRAPYKVYNIGNHSPIALLAFIETIEKKLGIAAKKELLPLQPGDMTDTYADVDDLVRDTGVSPGTSIEKGIGSFIDWYIDYYHAAR